MGKIYYLLASFDVVTFRETNLKVRQPLPETHELQDEITLLSKFDGKIIVAWSLSVQKII